MTPRVSRRLILSSGSRLAGAASAAGALALLTACDVRPTQPSSQPASAEPATIEYLTSLNARQQDNQKKLLVEPFEQANPRLKLNITVWDRYPDKLVTLVAGGTPPDVTWFAYPEAYLGGLVQDLTQYVRRDRYNTGILPKEAFEAYCTWRGKILGLPNQSGGNWPVLIYNKDVFRNAGLAEPPTAWGDSRWNAQAWLQALQQTTKNGPDGKPATYGINQAGPGVYIVNWSGLWRTAWLTDDYKTITCDSPQMIEAMEYLTSLMARHRVMASTAMMQEAFGDNNAQRNFLNGKLAMLLTAGGGTFAIAEAVRDRGLPLAYAPLPTFKVAGSAQAVDDNGIPTGAKHKEQAWTYIKWSADTPNWAISRGNAPARVDHFDAWSKEMYATTAQQMRLDVYRDSLRNTVKVDRMSQLPTYRQMSSEIIQPAFAKLFDGSANVASTLKEIKPALQAMVPASLPQ